MVIIGTRRERVVLELEDHFSTAMARAAAQTAVLDKQLDHMGGTSTKTSTASRKLTKDVDELGPSSRRSGSEVDKLSGRLRILGDVAAIIGPTLGPIGAVGTAALSGLASQAGFAVTGVGTLVFAFHGLGDVLKAVNKAQLEPTASNLEAANLAMAKLTPTTQAFVRTLASAQPEIDRLQEVAREGIFPGFTEGLNSASVVLPKVTALVKTMSDEIGMIGASTGESLASGRWDDFLDFLADQGPIALDQMAKAAGNTTHALAELWMATTPINNDFGEWLVDATADLDKWAAGLSKTDGFHEFVQYIEDTGPQVAATLGAISSAILQIVEAAAPIGGPVLKGLEALSNVISAIAESDLGTPIFGALAALALLNRSMAITQSLSKATFGGPAVAALRSESSAVRRLAADFAFLAKNKSMAEAVPEAGFIGPLTKGQTLGKSVSEAEGRLKSFGSTALKAGALVGGLTLATSGLSDSFAFTNTASLALAGSMAGPVGAAVGGTAGLLIDMANASTGATKAVDSLNVAIKAGDWNALQDGIKKAKSELDDLQNHSNPFDFLKDKFNDVWGGDFKEKLNVISPITRLFAEGKSASDLLKAKLKEAESAASDLTSTSRGLADILTSGLGPGFQRAAGDIDVATAALTEFQKNAEKVDSQLSGMQARISARNSLRELAKTVIDNPTGKNFNLGTAAADAVKAQLLSVLQAFRAGAKDLDGVDLNRYFRNASASVLDFATKLGLPISAVKELLKQAGIVAKTPIKPKVDPAPAIAGVKKVRSPLDELIKNDWVATVDVDNDPALRKIQQIRTEAQQVFNYLSSWAGGGGSNFFDGAIPKVPSTPSKPSGSGSPKSGPSQRAVAAPRGRSMGRLVGNGDGLGTIGFETPVDTKPGTQGAYGAKKPKKPKKKKVKASDVLTRQEYRDALSSLTSSLQSTLGLGPTGPGAEVRAAFKDFAEQIRKDGGKVGTQFRGLENRLVKTAVALDKQKTKLDSLNTSLDDLRQSAASLASSVSSGFTTDIFAAGYDPFAESDQAIRDAGGTPATHSAQAILGAGIQQVLTDSKNANLFAQDIEELKAKGFGGSGLEALANSNNLQMADALNALSPLALQSASAAFDARARATSAAGQVVSAAVFGDGIQKLSDQIAETNRRIDNLTTKEETLLTALPSKTGAAVASSLNHVASSASQKAGR